MAASQRQRLSPTSRRKRTTAPQVPQYTRTRAAIGLFIFLLVFGFGWILNGTFTATKVEQLGGDIMWGWTLHLVQSAIELAPIFVAPFIKGVPRTLLVVLWLISLPFGVFDVFSSADGMASWLRWTGATGTVAHIQNTVLGEVLAFLPEPMIVWLIKLLHRTLRG